MIDKLTSRISVFLMLLFPALAIVMLSGCGIPDYAYIDTPSADFTIIDNNLIAFTTTDQSADVIQGYEIYYLVYDPNISEHDEILKSESQLQSIGEQDLKNLVTTGDIFRPNSSKAYTRLCSVVEVEKLVNDQILTDFSVLVPIDEADRDSVFRISLDFADKSSPVIAYANRSTKKYVGRAVLNTAANIYEKKSFVPGSFSVNDHDIPDSLLATAVEKEYGIAAFYVVSKGFSIDSGTVKKLYSEAVYFGQIRWDLN